MQKINGAEVGIGMRSVAAEPWGDRSWQGRAVLSGISHIAWDISIVKSSRTLDTSKARWLLSLILYHMVKYVGSVPKPKTRIVWKYK